MTDDLYIYSREKKDLLPNGMDLAGRLKYVL